MLPNSSAVVGHSHRSSRHHHRKQNTNSQNNNNTLPKGIRLKDGYHTDNPPEYKLVSSYKTQRLPRSADPSPQRTVQRIESFGEKHGGNKKLSYSSKNVVQTLIVASKA